MPVDVADVAGAPTAVVAVVVALHPQSHRPCAPDVVAVPPSPPPPRLVGAVAGAPTVAGTAVAGAPTVAGTAVAGTAVAGTAVAGTAVAGAPTVAGTAVAGTAVAGTAGTAVAGTVVVPPRSPLLLHCTQKQWLE